MADWAVSPPVRVELISGLPYCAPASSRSSRGPGHCPFTAATGVRIPYGTPFRNRTANAHRRRARTERSHQRVQQIAPRSNDSDLAVRDLNALGERPQAVAAIAAAGDPYSLASRGSELPYHGRRDRLLARAFKHVPSPSSEVRDRDIVLGPPGRRDAQIEGGAQGRGHGKAPLIPARQLIDSSGQAAGWHKALISRAAAPPTPRAYQSAFLRIGIRSSAGPKDFVEEIAELCLEHIEFGVGDRHRIGPIVRDGPDREIMLRRPANARPRLRRDVKIVGQGAQAGTRTGHSASIARHDLRANDRSLSHNTLLLPAKT